MSEYHENRLDNRYKITVDIIIDADSIDDAEVQVKELIDHGIVAIQEDLESGKIYDYDIIESEPAEVE